MSYNIYSYKINHTLSQLSKLTFKPVPHVSECTSGKRKVIRNILSSRRKHNSTVHCTHTCNSCAISHRNRVNRVPHLCFVRSQDSSTPLYLTHREATSSFSMRAARSSRWNESDLLDGTSGPWKASMMPRRAP